MLFGKSFVVERQKTDKGGGTFSVIGPTRIACERAIRIVDIIAKLLTSALSHP